MADYNPPFSNETTNRRFPTTTEQDNGFECGALDIQMFNGIFHRIESEIGNVISYGGIAPQVNTDLTQLRQAITAMIDAATGGSGDFILMSQARARLPIHWEVQNTAGTIVVTSPSSGTVRIPSGTVFLHRGIYEITTSQEDLATSSSSTYHLRYDDTNGFALYDLADSGYNPSVLVETDSSFDSTYDDMLVARVVTNSSNVPTITNLSNKANLWKQTQLTGTNFYVGGQNFSSALINGSWNWARTPQNYSFTTVLSASNQAGDEDIDISLWDPSISLATWTSTIIPSKDNYGNLVKFPVTRYGTSFRYMRDHTDALIFDAALSA